MLAHFYNRDDEKNFVEKLLREGSSLNRSQRIINFSGLDGSGKTWFLQWLYHEYQNQKHTHCCFLKAEDVKSPAEVSPEALFKKVLRDLSEDADYTPPPNLNILEQSTIPELEAHLEHFLRALDESGDRKILLLIDDYEQFPSHLGEMLEKYVLWKMVKCKCALTVLTSRANDVTNRSQFIFQHKGCLRIHTHYRELTNFTYQDVSGQYQEYIKCIPQILRVTAGLPICVEHLIEQVQQRHVKTDSEFMEHEKEFVSLNYESPVKNRVLAEVKPEMQEVICILSIPRRFNIGVMKSLLPKIMPEKYQQCLDVNYLDLAQSLGDPSLWNLVRNAYSIREPVRRILSYYMALLDTKKFSEINEELLHVYEQQINSPSFKVHEYVEYLYHRLNRTRLSIGAETPRETISQRFFEDVETVFKQCVEKNMSIDELNELRMMLEADQDMWEYLSEATLQFMDQTVRSLEES